MAVNKVVFGAVSIMDISDSTVTADKLAKGVTAYDKTGEKITGTMEASSAPMLQEKTVTPSTAAKSITADNGYDGLSKVTVNGDANLTADNIKSGTSIFGVTGSYAGSSPKLQSKSVTYTSNGTATITPDAGYDGLKKVDVTVDVSGGGGGGAGFSVTFPATASNWNKLYVGGIVQVDGTVINMLDYSTVAGKTIPNVIEICFSGHNSYYPYMEVQTGKIMLTHVSPVSTNAWIAVDGEYTWVYTDRGSTSRWIPLADTVISSIEIVNTD